MREGGVLMLYGRSITLAKALLTIAFTKTYYWHTTYLKDEDEKCGGIFETSGTCKHGHFCYRSCVRNPKHLGDRCNEDFLSNIEGRCVSPEEKEELEQGQCSNLISGCLQSLISGYVISG